MLGGLEHKSLQAVIARAFRTAAMVSSSLVTANIQPWMDAGATINATIDALLVVSPSGGTVRIPDGSFTIETSILHKSGIHLQLGAGTILTAKTGLNAPVIKNATATTEKTITGVTNAGRVATATCIAHGYVANDWVHISGALPGEYDGWHKVVSAPTADTFTYYVDKNIAADTGTIKVFKYVDSNLKISGGGKIVGNAANTAGNNNGVRYDGVVTFQIDDLLVDGTYNTAVNILGCRSGKLNRVRGENVISAAQHGIALGATGASNLYADDMELVACEGNATAADGILVQLGFGVRLIACGAQYNALTGIKISGPHNVAAIGCWGKYNGGGLQIQGAGGNKDISVIGGEFIENGDAGILVGNLDATAPMRNITIVGNQCHRNGQYAAPTLAYGIAFEGSVGATIDRVMIMGNQCDEQTRGLSFGTDGSITNVTILGNRGKGNTADINFGASIDVPTLEYGSNNFPTFADGFSFTPVLTFATAGDLNVVYSQQHGRYWRDGNKVTVWVNILTSTFTHTTALSDLQITGLPFTSLNVANFTQLGGGLGWQGITKAGYTDINPFVVANSSIIKFAACGSGQPLAVIGKNDMPSGGTVQLTFQIDIRI